MISIDPRVGSKHLAPLLEALGVPYEITPLAFGDCSFMGNGPDGPVRVGIEIKGGRHGSDFIQSMQSGRLVGHQVPGLAEMYDRQYLIVEGVRVTSRGVIWTPPRRRFGKCARPLFADDIEKYLTGIEESGIRVRRTVSPEQTALVIAKQLYSFWQKPYDSHSSISANVLYQPTMFAVRKEDPTTARLRRVVVALKAGVGVGRSKAVAARFGSVYEMVNAEAPAWAEIEGIGKGITAGIVKAIRESAKTPTTKVRRVRAAARVVPARSGPFIGSSRHSVKR